MGHQGTGATGSCHVKPRSGAGGLSAGAFTLVELLVVIGIIALLIGILLPALSKAYDQANTLKCLTNLKDLGNAFTLYATENRNYMPPILVRVPDDPLNPPPAGEVSVFDYYPAPAGNAPLCWADVLIRGKYMTKSLMDCPSADPDSTVGNGTQPTKNGLEYVINGYINTPSGRLIGIAATPTNGDPDNVGNNDVDHNDATITTISRPGISKYSPWKINWIVRSSEGMLATDSGTPRGSQKCSVLSTDPNYEPGKLRHIRRTSTNVLFFDGHAETRVPGTWRKGREGIIFDNFRFMTGGGTHGGVYGSDGALRTQPTPFWRPWTPWFQRG